MFKTMRCKRKIPVMNNEGITSELYEMARVMPGRGAGGEEQIFTTLHTPRGDAAKPLGDGVYEVLVTGEILREITPGRKSA